MGREVFEYFIKMNNLTKCEICRSKEIKPLFKQKDKNLNISQEFYLSKCSNCKVIFLNPQPSYKELEKYYSSDKYYSLKQIQSKEESNKVKLNFYLYNRYFNSKNNNFIAKILFSPLKFMIRGTKIEKNKNILDIGSGSGQFLYEMKESGMNVWGVEPGDFDNKGNKKYNLNIKNSDLIKAKYQKEFFDVITMNHVLEHLNNPEENIKEVHRILKNKGNFIIGIPNSNSLAYKIFKKNWHQLDIPRHLFNYSNKNVRILLEKNGFKIYKIRYNSRPNQFVVSLYFLLGIKKRAGILNRILELFFLPLTWIVNSLKIGDQIEIWCIKE
jgi:2-polyprenyl-3-methyl-5-hydroxy-6-metoxy-1,4-benzoquinol methylase